MKYCECGCGRQFEPKQPTQLYFDKKCQQRVKDRRRRPIIDVVKQLELLKVRESSVCRCGCGVTKMIGAVYASRACRDRMRARKIFELYGLNIYSQEYVRFTRGVEDPIGELVKELDHETYYDAD